MASQQELKEANYIHRGDDGKYIEGLGQCGFSPCDYSKIIKDDKTGEECRYCMKLQIPVDCYDSCKYHSDERISGLIGEWATLLKEESEAKTTQNRPAKEKKKRKHWLLILVIVCIVILIYMLNK